MSEKLPSVFIGSSAEGLDVAREIELQLQYDALTTIWKDGVFGLGAGTLESLLSAVNEFDFAIMVLSPDDMLESRNQNYSSPRDNVLFELGLFMGRIGRHRTFIVQEKDADLKIPSDLAGITTTPYRKRENLSAALSPACTPIIKAIRSLGQTDEHRSAEIQGDLLPNLLVEIFWTVDGERGKIATGVAIGSNHILTAAHILDDSNGSFEIRWNMGNNWQDASMVWTGEDEGFDLVVLNVNSPFDLPSELTPHIISSSAPAAGTFWYGAGFARALRREEKRSEPLPMSGNVCPIARHGSGFQLDVDIGPREEMGWAGAGGAPILIGNKLYGTVSHVVAGFGGRRLVATSLWRLLENQKFRHALGL